MNKIVLALLLFVQPVQALDKQVNCLALTVYHESRGEPVEGQLYVARTVLNRVKHSRYPDDICRVVYQKHQFSWTKHKHKQVDKQQLNKIAYMLANHKIPEHDAIYFYNKRVKVKRLKLVKQINNHRFYKDL